jgi:hypothetical protein
MHGALQRLNSVAAFIQYHTPDATSRRTCSQLGRRCERELDSNFVHRFWQARQSAGRAEVLRRPGDEWRSGDVLDAFDGKGMLVTNTLIARYLKDLIRNSSRGPGVEQSGREATDIVVGDAEDAHPGIIEGGRYRGLGNGIPFGRRRQSNSCRSHRTGQQMYSALQAQNTRLLRDLQHYNILFDRRAAGWR